jgi:hypothetical protein
MEGTPPGTDAMIFSNIFAKQMAKNGAFYSKHC